MKLAIHLLTWNGNKYIPYLFDSLRKQTFNNYKLIILDNASTDDTVEKIKIELQNFPVEYELIINKENKGFAGGHNQLIVDCKTEYVLLLNQDMFLMPDCLEKLVEFMNSSSEVAVVSPRLMKWDFSCPSLTKRGWPTGRESLPEFGQTSATPSACLDGMSGRPTPSWKEGDIEKSFTNQIDTLGLKVLRNRRVVELNAGEDWSSCHCEEADKKADEAIPMKQGIATSRSGVTRNDSAEVFGVSGALPMFRKSVIDEIGLFDETYGSYKEDVDLAYRLRLAGHKAYVLLNAVAYHDRSAAGPENLGDSIAIANKKQQSSWVKYHSYKNHLMTLIKNEYWQNYLLDLPFIKWYELKKFVYFLLFDRQVLKGLGELYKNFDQLKIKRKKIKEIRRVSWREMRKWWKH
ncbi:MAG: Glycosyl transferase family protein [Candidatus Magasanikbacteria bacterium GW2011_GWC2_37_14]|uniref:Glycosyl transferase family protein n=1 Tax=Candidatus Magasanikbacteria bacterium GW2011_GWC2_37_14 TaxID=1619046 RepID=A0A0G0JGQ1_9BACT|nr:MAG: Glycosyl transferase family protein [Candidatus Magasanikbacteria bacterium GW2011_GWC2_37_14]